MPAAPPPRGTVTTVGVRGSGQSSVLGVPPRNRLALHEARGTRLVFSVPSAFGADLPVHGPPKASPRATFSEVHSDPKVREQRRTLK